MLLIIGLSIAIGLLLFVPEQLFVKRTSYDFLKLENRNKPMTMTSEVDEKMIKGLIKMSRKIGPLVPYDMPIEKEQNLQVKINIAGMENLISPKDVINIKVLLSTIFGGYVSFIAVISGEMSIVILGVIGLVLAYMIPDYFIVATGRRRQREMVRNLPNVLTSLAIITDAGLNLIPAVHELVEQNKGVLVEELRKTLDEIQIGISQTEAFLRMTARCQIEEINYFVSAMVQGFEKGNSGLTKIIREQAEESLQKRRFEAKALAEKASMKLFFPLLCMVFPAFSIFLIGPMFFSLVELFDLL